MIENTNKSDASGVSGLSEKQRGTCEAIEAEMIKRQKLTCGVLLLGWVLIVMSCFVTVGYAADGPMLHNSNRFPGTLKHGGSWGLPGTTYGEITCVTCHDRDTGNIKRVRKLIVAPNGTDSFPIEGAVSPNDEVTFTSAEDSSSDFGDDAGGHSASTKVCEACHSQNKYHNYDTANNSSGLTHENQGDCIACHPHSVGFKASCTACHGNPPTTNDTNGSTTTGLVHDPAPTGGTNLASAGAHTAHAVTLSMKCDTCHKGNTMPTVSNTIQMGFEINNANWSAIGATITGGSINAPQAGNMTNGFTYTSGDGGTTTVVEQAISNPNCAVYCHGNWAGNGGQTTTVWTSGAAMVNDCNDCHGGSSATPPTAGSHQQHAGNGAGDLGLACAQCHPSYSDTGHIDGDVAWNVTALSGGTPTYNGAASGLTGAKAPSASYGDCASIYCHSTGQSTSNGSSAVPTYATVTWGSGGGCGTCHQVSDAGLTSGTHNKHLNSTLQAIGCDSCHTGAANDASSYSLAAHVDGQIDVAAGVSYSAAGAPGNGYGTCTTASCHGTATWGGGALGCDSCHTAASDTDDYTWGSTKALIGTTEWNSTGHGGYGTANLACTDCHSTGVAHNVGTNYFRLSDNSNALCMGCHNANQGATLLVDGATHDGSGHSATDNGGYLCWDCHDPHGDAPIEMIQTRPWIQHDSNGKPSKIADVDVSFSAKAAWGDFVNSASPWDGICQICHESSVYTFTNGGFYRYSSYPTVSGGYDSTHQTGEATGDHCTKCHNHSSFVGSGSCVSCHTANYVPDAIHLKHKVHILAVDVGMTDANKTDDLSNWTAARHPICATCHDMSVQGNHTDATDYIAPGSTWEYDNSATPPAYDGLKTCSNISCHYKSTPAWK
ncbi:MAG: CxxxxCH/CxxCH domain-containing protein [Desulfuromonadales bacterium]|nr:CxxxxCH/CxxCH domain-containing protein [Desulfuromonadales bacterium]